MSLEPTVTYIGDLNPVWPTPDDPKAAGDDHIRNVKKALRDCFPGFTGAVLLGGADTGAANTYVLTPATPLPGYVANMMVVFKPLATNTTQAPTLNVSALGAKSILDVAGNPVLTGDLPAGQYVALVYDGTAFRLAGVTKNYVDQLVFKPVLPAMTGNKGKFLRTTGVAAYWDAPGISEVAPVATIDVKLTDSYLYIPVEMTAVGKSITLPDATTLTTGGPLYVIDNSKGGFAVGIRDSAGALVMAVVAGGVAMVLLRNNSTAAGDWLVTGSGLEPGLVTADFTFSTTYGTVVYPAHVVMDANTSVHFAVLAAGGYAAFVVDSLGKVISTPVVIDATSGQVPLMAFKIDATRIIVFTGNRAIVLLLNGASPSYTISTGNFATVTHGENLTGMPKIVQLAPTTFVLMNAFGLATTALSINGTVITTGATSTVPGDSAGDPSIYALTATTALVLYSTNSAGALKAYVVSVSGTSITRGTVATGVATVMRSTCLLSPTKAIATGALGGTGVAAAVTISGTDVTFGPTYTISTNTPNLGTNDDGANRYNPHLTPISANSALLWYRNASSSIALVLSESNGVLTGAPFLAGSFNSGFVAAASPTDFAAIVKSASNNFTLVPHRITGDVITSGLTQALPEIPPEVVAGATPAVRMGQGDYMVFAAGISAVPVFRLNGNSAIKRGSVATPNMAGPSAYPLMVISPRRLVVMAASGTQLRLLNFEVAI